MAATIQTQPTQQSPSSLLNTNNNNKSSNPKLKRIVYSKYRELLGSYNDKANAIIDSLPAYMVKEDRGFHFDQQIIDAVDNVVYGTPPAPPPLSAGSLPSQRLSTQIPQYNVAEAPACVQNAMMTKDKKPFTYTPGGIDLSQIKSQRMAKRLARNAQSEGTTGQQQMHRPTQLPSQQQHQSNGASAPAAAQLGATAMGMPFQVLPTGPPAPPPQPGKVGAAPPPPPPAPQNKLAPQSNGNAPRRSPTPQNFEPPPMGFRPEIKIPPNPMASLKKVPPPQEKNNFWMEEYRKERSKSPMVGNDENDNNYRSSPPNNPKPETNQYSYNNNNNSQNDYQQPQQNQYRAPQSPQPMRQQQQQQEFYNQNQPSPPRTPVQQKRIESPYQTQQYSQQQQQSPTIQRQTSQYAPPPSPQYQQQQNSPQQSSPTIQRQQSQSQQQQYQNSPQHSPQIQRQQSIPTQQQYHQNSPQPQQSPSIQRQQTVPQSSQYQSPTSPQYQQQQQQQQQTSSPTQQQSVPWRQQKQVPLGIQNNVSRARDVMSPAPAESPRPQQQQYPTYLRSREALSPAPEQQQQQQQQSPQLSQPYQQKNAQVGSIYIPPVVNQQQQQQYSPYQDSQGSRQQQPLQQQQQQTPRQAPTNRWMNAQGQPVENQTISRIKSPPPPTTSSTPVSSNGFAGSHNNAGLRLQINTNTSSSNGKERIIPIQLEQTPTPTRTPSAAPGFGPQPFYNSAQQQLYSSVPSPPMNQGTPNNGQNSPNYVIRSPNQFVDQGYNQYTGVQDHPSRVTSPPMQQQQQQQQSRIIQQTSTAGGIKTRIIPIAVESQPDGPLNPNNARGPISQQPIVIQNDPRNQNTWGNGGGASSATPTQSKSFRILQKITDTSDDSALENKAIDSDGGSVSGSQEHEPQLQRPSFARQMTSTGQINSPNNVEQMKRMQLNNNEQQQVYANRARNQGTPPVMKQPQPNRYVSQRPVYSPDEHSQQYVHPSEQQVPEPKIYTGSAIPSRSFKILQAMTTPENAGPGQSDL